MNDLAKAFPGKTLPDLRTAELDAWLGGLRFGAKTKNGMRIILVACGNWAEGRGYLIKGRSPFPAMMRYKETKTSVSIFTPENIASLVDGAVVHAENASAGKLGASFNLVGRLKRAM